MSFRRQLPGQYSSFKGVTITHESSASSATDAAGYTFSGMALGAAASNRYLIIAVGSRVSVSDITAVTVGGNSATEIIDSGSTASEVQLWGLTLATGTTGDVVITHAGTSQGGAATVFRMVGHGSTTPTGTDGQSGGTTSEVVTVDVPARGAVVACALGNDNADAPTMNTTNLTRDHNGNDFTGDNDSWAAGHDNYAASQTGLAITFTPTATALEIGAVAASWGP